MGQVDELTRSDLRHPDVHPPVAVRLEGHEPPVARDRGCLLDPVEVGQLQEAGARERVLPRGLAPLQVPDRRGHGENGRRGAQQPEGKPPVPPAAPAGSRARSASSSAPAPVPAAFRDGLRPVLGGLGGGYGEASAFRPGVDFRPERVDRPHLVVKVTVDRQPFPLLPALHRGDVALQVRGDLLPRVEPVRRRVFGGGG